MLRFLDVKGKWLKKPDYEQGLWFCDHTFCTASDEVMVKPLAMIQDNDVSKTVIFEVYACHKHRETVDKIFLEAYYAGCEGHPNTTVGAAPKE